MFRATAAMSPVKLWGSVVAKRRVPGVPMWSIASRAKIGHPPQKKFPLFFFRVGRSPRQIPRFVLELVRHFRMCSRRPSVNRLVVGRRDG